MPRYILYARKSTESEDRQVLSIDSQIKELQDLARESHIAITTVLSEARSAKAPGRVVFGQILAEIAKGGVDGIVCWKLDRLARNPVDGGALIWAFDEGKLKEIVTPGRTFTNTGNDKFWLQLEFGIAKKYVDDLSDNVKRGNRAKLALGWRPGPAPVGYLNDRLARTIVPDPQRFSLVRRIWDLILAGRAPAEVFRMVNDEWGFRTRKSLRMGNRPFAHSGFYKLLSNPFYYGLILSKGESYPGAHEPMITKDEFDRVQELLGRPNRKQTKRYLFAFTGLIRCGECGAMVTAEEQVNRYGSHYIYYHCTKRLTHTSCSQRMIRAEKLEEQIQATLSSLQIDDEIRDWALVQARAAHADEAGQHEKIAQSLADARKEFERQAAQLLEVRLRGLITDGEYAEKKRHLTGELVSLSEREARGPAGAGNWFEPFSQAVLFANLAPNRFSVGSAAEKREIVLALGSNYLLRDRILRTELQEPFALMVQQSQTVHPWALVDGIRTFFLEYPTAIRWPAFCRSLAEEQRHSSIPAEVVQGA